MAEFFAYNGKGYLHQEGEDEETDCPDPKGHHEFQEVRNINVDFSKRIRDKSCMTKPGPFSIQTPMIMSIQPRLRVLNRFRV